MLNTGNNLPEPMANLTTEQWEAIGISRDDFSKRWRMRLDRDVNAPVIGAPAPDFNLEILSSEGVRTGETFRLSSVRGQPVGLVFGSYT